ncbi:hypothetical protein, partial [Lyngbya sp. CCY1209]|uniref:hypothetical protein n=1 Tax=Lyngbya sp. CCY1209 TaxID=2886103 RepID=UPI002D20AA5B
IRASSSVTEGFRPQFADQGDERWTVKKMKKLLSELDNWWRREQADRSQLFKSAFCENPQSNIDIGGSTQT